MSSFNKYLEKFEVLNSFEVENLIKEQKDIIVFIGRASCPFCQIFVPKISTVVKKIEESAIFINSENFEDIFLEEFRNKYSIKTVPGLLVAKEGELKVVCDSSLSEEKILEFITK